jgi:hypothetical protein
MNKTIIFLTLIFLAGTCFAAPRKVDPVFRPITVETTDEDLALDFMRSIRYYEAVQDDKQLLRLKEMSAEIDRFLADNEK